MSDDSIKEKVTEYVGQTIEGIAKMVVLYGHLDEDGGRFAVSNVLNILGIDYAVMFKMKRINEQEKQEFIQKVKQQNNITTL